MRPLPLILALAGCADTTRPADLHEGEVITTVGLRFVPTDGGAEVVATWTDPEGDGAPVVDPIVLDVASDYELQISFRDELSQPPEDLTDEIAAEAEEHQVFATGTAVQGPATGENAEAIVTQAYLDADADGFPVGLLHAITPIGPGSGELVLTLRHLPVEGGVPVKTGSLALDLAAGRALPGDIDAVVTFAVTVE